MNGLDKWTNTSVSALRYADEFRQECGHKCLTTVHLLVGLAYHKSSIASHALLFYGISDKTIRSGIEAVKWKEPEQSPTAGLSLELDRCCDLATTEMREIGDTRVGTEHLLIAMTKNSECCAFKLLQQMQYSPIEIQLAAYELLGVETEAAAAKPELERPRSPAVEAILGKSFKVLDDGFVRVIDYMGDDSAIVQAARVSYGAGTKKVSEDRGLIRYLMRHRHTTPFEMCELKLHVRVPMDCWRQWIRHRMANVNEYSTRYSVAIDASQRTTPEDWRSQATGNRQGSEGMLPLEQGQQLTNREKELHELARAVYYERLERGVAREQARKDLPLSTYTEAYWKIDLHNLLHFLALRMEGHAQKEIRDYATVIGEQIVSKWVPLTWEAFQDYRFNAVSFSSIEQSVLEMLVKDRPEQAVALAEAAGWLKKSKNGTLAQNRERSEFETKIQAWGLIIPWAD